MSTNSSWPTRRARPPAWTSLWPSCRPSTPSRRRPKGARSRAWVLAIAVVLPNDGERSSNHNSLITSAIVSGVATETGRMNLLLIPLDEAIIFPAVTATLPIDPGDEERVFLLPRRNSEFRRVGVVAEVIERGQLPNGTPVATVVGLFRGLAAGPAASGVGDELRIEVQEIHDG